MKILYKHEFDRLVSCIMAYPYNIQSVIGNPAINKDTALEQYNVLVNTLEEHGVNVHFLDLNDSTSQVFTRDIGFIIDDILFISNMTQLERQPEILELMDFANMNNLKSHIMENKVEGGDILVHHDKVFIGIGNRTNLQAVMEIDNVLSSHNKKYELITVFFNPSRIHLDCALNIVEKSTCIITKDVYNTDDVLKHFSNYIESPMEEQDSLAVNIVDVGNNVILCSSKVFSNILSGHDYKPIFIDFNEIIKAKVSLGCCLMPLLRIPK